MEFIKFCNKHNCDKVYRERLVKQKVRREYICNLCIIERNASREDKYKDGARVYYENNKIQIVKQKTKYKKIRRKIDPAFRIRESVSASIRTAIKSIGFIKNNSSFQNHVSWTTDDLKVHLESLFEPWMSWDNWGLYDPKIWDDNDQSTWTWNIDHIIPQSELIYTSMEDDNFKKCWSLDNLRPYSSKQNCLDGANRTRHK